MSIRSVRSYPACTTRARAAALRGATGLFRHFPTRDALVEAAYRIEVAQLCDVEDILRDRPPDAALAEWMNRFVDSAVAKRGVSGALRSLAAFGSDIYDDTRRQVLAALTQLLKPESQPEPSAPTPTRKTPYARRERSG
ncbi:MAG: hypothetical protein M3O89_09915 [Actinomycetota bacterium]|nr:hypothetical protein [Actinomycetota bacterium]